MPRRKASGGYIVRIRQNSARGKILGSSTVYRTVAEADSQARALSQSGDVLPGCVICVERKGAAAKRKNTAKRKTKRKTTKRKTTRRRNGLPAAAVRAAGAAVKSPTAKKAAAWAVAQAVAYAKEKGKSINPATVQAAIERALGVKPTQASIKATAKAEGVPVTATRRNSSAARKKPATRRRRNATSWKRKGDGSYVRDGQLITKAFRDRDFTGGAKKQIWQRHSYNTAAGKWLLDGFYSTLAAAKVGTPKAHVTRLGSWGRAQRAAGRPVRYASEKRRNPSTVEYAVGTGRRPARRKATKKNPRARYGPLPKSKKFGDKTYRYATSHDTEAQAKSAAKKLRAKGLNARVYGRKTKASHRKKLWGVYKRGRAKKVAPRRNSRSTSPKKKRRAPRRNPRPRVTGPYEVTVLDTLNNRQVQRLRGGNTQREAQKAFTKMKKRYHDTPAGRERYVVEIVGQYMGSPSSVKAAGPGFRRNARAGRRAPVSRPGSKRVSLKIAKLIREGKSQKQAAAIAYALEREGRIGPRGGLLPKRR